MSSSPEVRRLYHQSKIKFCNRLCFLLFSFLVLSRAFRPEVMRILVAGGRGGTTKLAVPALSGTSFRALGYISRRIQQSHM